jgi:hypothetical protein
MYAADLFAAQLTVRSVDDGLNDLSMLDVGGHCLIPVHSIAQALGGHPVLQNSQTPISKAPILLSRISSNKVCGSSSNP